MKKALCVLTLLGIVVAASAETDVRLFLTTQPPPVTFRAGFGPFTPWQVGGVLPDTYDIHRNYVSATNPGSVGTPKFTNALLPLPVEPGVGPPGSELPEGTPVYIWGVFAGPGYDPDGVLLDPPDPTKPGVGYAQAGTRVQGLHIVLQTTDTLAVQPRWYQYVVGTATAVSGLRWAETSDMSGTEVTMVGLGTGTPAATGWYAGDLGVTGERMQNWEVDPFSGGLGGYGWGGILLGAITTTGKGDLYIGLGYNGLNSTDPAGEVQYFAGTEDIGIHAGVLPQGSPTRMGQTPEARWIPEPASLLLIGLGALVLRRR